MKNKISYCTGNVSILFMFMFMFIMLYILPSWNPLQAQWIQTSGPNSPVVSLAVVGTDLYAGTNTQRGTGGVYICTLASPSTWTSVNTGLVNHYVTALGVHNSVLFAGTYPSGPFYRYTGGIWEAISTGNDTYGTAFASQDTRFFAGTFLRGAYRSSDAGTSWTTVNTGLQAFPSVQCFALNGSSLFAGTSDSGIYRSTNYGSSWTRASNGLSNLNVYALAVMDTILFASVPGSSGFSVYRSMNDGATWEPVNSQPITGIKQFAVSGQNIFGVAFAAGVYRSTDLGVNWDLVNTGLPNGLTILSIAIRGANLYVGSSYTATTNGFVYYRPLSEVTTGIHESGVVPIEFSIEQNYPNPFNPSTHLEFRISKLGFVSLKVYDVLGNEMKTLVHENKPAGTYEVTFEGANLPSGVYYYKLSVGIENGKQFTEVKKMVLAK